MGRGARQGGGPAAPAAYAPCTPRPRTPSHGTGQHAPTQRVGTGAGAEPWDGGGSLMAGDGCPASGPPSLALTLTFLAGARLLSPGSQSLLSQAESTHTQGCGGAGVGRQSQKCGARVREPARGCLGASGIASPMAGLSPLAVRLSVAFPSLCGGGRCGRVLTAGCSPSPPPGLLSLEVPQLPGASTSPLPVARPAPRCN